MAAPTYLASTGTETYSHTGDGSGAGFTTTLSLARSDFGSYVSPTASAVVVARINFRYDWSSSPGANTDVTYTTPGSWTVAAVAEENSGGASIRQRTRVVVWLAPAALGSVEFTQSSTQTPTATYPTNIAMSAHAYSPALIADLGAADFDSVNDQGTPTNFTTIGTTAGQDVRWVQALAANSATAPTVNTANGFTSRYANASIPSGILLDQQSADTSETMARFDLVANPADTTIRYVTVGFALERDPYVGGWVRGHAWG